MLLLYCLLLIVLALSQGQKAEARPIDGFESSPGEIGTGLMNHGGMVGGGMSPGMMNQGGMVGGGMSPGMMNHGGMVGGGMNPGMMNHGGGMNPRMIGGGMNPALGQGRMASGVMQTRMMNQDEMMDEGTNPGFMDEGGNFGGGIGNVGGSRYVDMLQAGVQMIKNAIHGFIKEGIQMFGLATGQSDAPAIV